MLLRVVYEPCLERMVRIQGDAADLEWLRVLIAGNPGVMLAEWVTLEDLVFSQNVTQGG